MRTITGVLLIATTTAIVEFTPARRLDGMMPPLPPPTAVGWLEETVDLAVDAKGVVCDIATLRGTTPSPKLLGPVAATWRFRPASEARRPVSSHVLVAALFRPPQLYDGPTLGTRPGDLAPVSAEIPYPRVTHRPRYPPLAVGDAAVLVEVLVGADGQVRDAAIVAGAAGFNDEALSTAWQWVFRPARHNGKLVPEYAYLVFGFRQPVG
jgi:Gram-negative bacterial TonB protein C-terminal